MMHQGAGFLRNLYLNIGAHRGWLRQRNRNLRQIHYPPFKEE